MLQPAYQHASALQQSMTPGLTANSQANQHQSSAGLGIQVPDVIDLLKIAAMLQSQQQRMDGLEKLA